MNSADSKFMYTDLFQQLLKDFTFSYSVVSEHNMKRNMNDNLIPNFYIFNLSNANDIVYRYVIFLVFPVMTHVFEPATRVS